MKLFIKELLLIFLLFVGTAFAQNNPDYFPNGRKININPPMDNTNLLSAYWSTVATSPSAVSRSCVAYYMGSSGIPYIYQFGGGADASLTKVLRYNVSTDVWETSGFTPIPFSMSAATAITIGSNIYLFGGELYGGLGRTLIYSPEQNTWDTTASAMPVPVTDAAVVKYNYNPNNPYVLVIGGGNGYFPGDGYTNVVQLFDVNAKTYTQLPSSNYPIKAGMMGFGIFNDTIICTGGFRNEGSSSNPGVVDSTYKGIITKDFTGKPTKVTWSSLPKYPGGPITRMASTNVRKGNAAGVLFSGGAFNGVAVVTTTYYWDFLFGFWRQIVELPLARANMRATGVTDSTYYVVAGFTTLGTGQTDKLTFKNIDGFSDTLKQFNLVAPQDNAVISSIPGSIVPVVFNWDVAGAYANYRFRFWNTSNVKKIDTLLNQNLYKITSGDLDNLLKNLGLNQGDSLKGTWDVMAFKGPGAPGLIDSLYSNGPPRNVTFKRYKPLLFGFNLVLPIDSSSITTSAFTYQPVVFSWTKAGLGARYITVLYSSGSDSLTKRKVINSNLNGLDSVYSVANNILDSILSKAPFNMTTGASLSAKWKVYAISGNDSLQSNQIRNITLNRRALNLIAPSLISPANNAVYDLSISQLIGFNWTSAAVGSKYILNLGSATVNTNFDTSKVLSSNDIIQLIGGSIPVGGSYNATWSVTAMKGTDTLSSSTRTVTFNRPANKPLLETFDSLTFPPLGWDIDFQGTNRWMRDPVYNGSAKFDFFNAPAGTVQSLVTNVFPVTRSAQSQGSDTLYFKFAHAFVSLNNTDSLFIYNSTNGGLTYSLLTDANYGSNPVPFASLSTTTFTNGSYTPGSASEWGTKKLPLPLNTNRVKFMVQSGWGNNLFLDSIRIKNKPPSIILPGDYVIVTEVPELRWEQMFIYPGYNVYHVQVSFDSTFTQTPFFVDTLIADTNTITPNKYFPIDNKYTMRASVLNPGNRFDAEKFSVVPHHFYIDSVYKLNNDFSNPLFPQVCWRIDKGGLDSNYWSRFQIGDNFAAKFSFFTTPSNASQSLITNTFEANQNSDKDTLTFDYAQGFVSNFRVDSLFIYYSINSGNAWIRLDTARFGASDNFNNYFSLSTATATTTDPFVPTASQWRTKTIVLPDNTNKVKFVTLSSSGEHGNNLYIDNVKLNNGAKLTSANIIPNKYKLNYNYPNPFNPVTTFSFDIPKTSLTKLKIYDVLGREIVTLVNEIKQPGEYKVTFNASALASGVYFYRLESGSFIDVKKMLLIK